MSTGVVTQVPLRIEKADLPRRATAVIAKAAVFALLILFLSMCVWLIIRGANIF